MKGLLEKECLHEVSDRKAPGSMCGVGAASLNFSLTAFS